MVVKMFKGFFSGNLLFRPSTNLQRSCSGAFFHNWAPVTLGNTVNKETVKLKGPDLRILLQIPTCVIFNQFNT